MTYYIVKIVISAILVVAISEISKRSSLLGALLASIPLVSLLLKQGYNFYLSMGASIMITIGCYWLMVTVLDRVGIEL